jgi:hypothetical protein
MNQRDPLIGLGNRLHAANLLSALQPAGDDVLCSTWIGSAVNDSDGGTPATRSCGSWATTCSPPTEDLTGWLVRGR